MKRVLIFFCLLCIKFCRCNPDWLIFEEPGIEDQYFDFKRNFLEHVTTKSEDQNLDFETLDEFLKKTPDKLGHICTRLKNSKIYRRAPLLIEFPPPSNLEFIHSESEANTDSTLDTVNRTEFTTEIKYAYRPLKAYFGTTNEKISVFPCETHKGRVYWLTFGFSNTSIYLLQEVDNGEAVLFVGRAEKVPEVDLSYPRGKLLDEYYMSPVPKQTILYSSQFAKSTLFRVCCLAYEARQNALVENDEKFTINYASFDQHVKYHPNKIELLRSDDTSEEKTANVVACVINRKPESSKTTFYLTEDLRQPDAIFILDSKKNKSEEDVLTLTARMIGLSTQNRHGFYFA